jgi:hypothetical protein
MNNGGKKAGLFNILHEQMGKEKKEMIAKWNSTHTPKPQRPKKLYLALLARYI